MTMEDCHALDSTREQEPVVKTDTPFATINPCTLCAPLGAALATTGIENAISLLHGAQGCATYIRRYLISHFREPVDVASSSFGESQTVFGGESNLASALDNVERQYTPNLVCVATTCVAETVGEDVQLMLTRYESTRDHHLATVTAATPSYRDGHAEGFHAMVHSVVRSQSNGTGDRLPRVNVLPPIVSPADMRHLREIVEGFGVEATILPDYSETLDGAIAETYSVLPKGGTPLADIREMPRAQATIDLTMTGRAPRASDILRERGCSAHRTGLPVGVQATDAFIDTLASVTGREAPEWLSRERGRLLDAYADGHKYVFGKRVAVYGDPELVVAIARFLLEVGAKPVVCATGARNRALTLGLADLEARGIEEILDDTDFSRLKSACERTKTELAMGSSKGYSMTRALGIPLLRVGFPIHDRVGAARILHTGYRGAMCLFDLLVNTLLYTKQEASKIGFSYM